MTHRFSRRAALGGLIAAPFVSSAFAQTASTLKIGTILSTTGPAAFLGEDMRAGVELAIEEINAAGGIGGRRLEWFFYDGESQTQRAINATRRLLTQDRVDAIVGGGSMSGIALAMAPLCEQAGVPFMATEGAMGIVQPPAERRFVFKSTVDDDKVLERLADWCAKKNMSRVAMLGELLRAPVHVADDRLAVHDPLAVEREPQPEHAVRSRVLRSDVEHHVLGGEPLAAAALVPGQTGPAEDVTKPVTGSRGAR
jgi:ABC-type branched-subunit amino acid transport system substrate-binding protein